MDFYAKGKYYFDRGGMDKARECFIGGLENGDAKCAYGMLAISAVCGHIGMKEKEELEKAFPQLLEKARGGDAECAFIVGRCYETGCICTPNPCYALKYYCQSAEAGNADAMYNLACMQMSVTGNDLNNISEHFYSAAKAGSIHACFSLGMMYEQKGDVSQALCWYKLAAEDGSEEMKKKYKDIQNFSESQ